MIKLVLTITTVFVLAAFTYTFNKTIVDLKTENRMLRIELDEYMWRDAKHLIKKRTRNEK